MIFFQEEKKANSESEKNYRFCSDWFLNKNVYSLKNTPDNRKF